MKRFLFEIIAVISLQLLLCRGADPRPRYVISWGMNLNSKELIIPTPDYFSTNIVKIEGKELNDAISISGGGSHGLALKADGTVAAWGNNLSGASVGFETPYPQATNGLVKLEGKILSNVVAVAASCESSQYAFSLALKQNGTVVAWGGNQFGQTSIPSDLSNVTAIAAGAFQGLALKRDGTIVSWGQGNPPPEGLSNVVAIAAGGESGRNLALKKDGTVVDWPVRSVRYFSTVPPGLTNVVAIAASGSESLALRRDGTIVGWGPNDQGEVTGVVPGKYTDYTYGRVTMNNQPISNVVAISAGYEYGLALKRDGTVAFWGQPGQMKWGAPAGLSNVVSISAGYTFCLAITTNPAVAAEFRH